MDSGLRLTLHPARYTWMPKLTKVNPRNEDMDPVLKAKRELVEAEEAAGQAEEEALKRAAEAKIEEDLLYKADRIVWKKVW
jgi:hypothetical protein